MLHEDDGALLFLQTKWLYRETSKRPIYKIRQPPLVHPVVHDKVADVANLMQNRRISRYQR